MYGRVSPKNVLKLILTQEAEAKYGQIYYGSGCRDNQQSLHFV